MKRSLFLALTVAMMGAAAHAMGGGPNGGSQPPYNDPCSMGANSPPECFNGMVADTCADVQAYIKQNGVGYVTTQGGDDLGPIMSEKVAYHHCKGSISYYLVWTQDNAACGAGFQCSGVTPGR